MKDSGKKTVGQLESLVGVLPGLQQRDAPSIVRFCSHPNGVVKGLHVVKRDLGVDVVISLFLDDKASIFVVYFVEKGLCELAPVHDLVFMSYILSICWELDKNKEDYSDSVFVHVFTCRKEDSNVPVSCAVGLDGGSSSLDHSVGVVLGSGSSRPHTKLQRYIRRYVNVINHLIKRTRTYFRSSLMMMVLQCQSVRERQTFTCYLCYSDLVV